MILKISNTPWHQSRATLPEKMIANLPIKGGAQTPEEDLVVYVYWHCHCVSNHRHTVFGLTIMSVKTPKVRSGATNVRNLNNFVPTTPSFDIPFATQIRVKNKNWGPYEFDAGTATFMYQGVAVGQVFIPKSKAGMRSLNKINVEVSLHSNGIPITSDLGSELSCGVFTLTTKSN